MLAHKRPATLTSAGTAILLRPDAAQVTIEYENGRPIRVDKVCLLTATPVKQAASTRISSSTSSSRDPEHMVDSQTKPPGQPLKLCRGARRGYRPLGRKIIVDT